MTTNSFAIYHTWPDMRNAEYEVLQRIIRASKNINKNAVVINNAGEVLWADAATNIRIGSIISRKDVDFALSLHFESPRTIDVYSYYALWQPLEFYDDFGYDYSINNFSTHHDLVSCHSDVADFHALNIFNGLGRHTPTPLPTLFHAVPEPFLEPRISDQASLFYVGINWERIGRPKGRFHDLLTKLDEKDLVKIYGPELVQGVAPWAGFSTYSGELPFDGSSVVEAINECGICLALSSKPHQDSGIMSNRLFEGLAGGAAVIANPNPLIEKYFKDVVYVVDDNHGSAYLEQKILSFIREIRSNPDAARDRVLRGQQIIREFCSLEGSLNTLFEQTPFRQENYYGQLSRNALISVILVATEVDAAAIDAKILEISEQIFCAIDLHLIVPSRFVADCKIDPLGAITSVAVHGFEFETSPAEFDGPELRATAVGGFVGNILSSIVNPYFAIMHMNDMVMHDHFSSLVSAISREDGSICAASGSLNRSRDILGREQRKLHELRPQAPDKLLLAEGEIHSGQLLFRKAAFKPEHNPLLHLLDGCEHHVFLLESLIGGAIAQSNMATHLHDQAAPIQIRGLPISNDMQRQFIRDFYSANARWTSKTGFSTTSDSTSSNKKSILKRRDKNRHLRRDGSKYLPVNRTVVLNSEAEGLNYLGDGFSIPELDGTWLDGVRGVIEFTLPHDASSALEDYRILLGLLGLRNSETGRMQHCTFIINNVAVAYHAIPDFKSQVSIKVPLNIMSGSGSFSMEIIADHACCVRNELGEIIDPRELSVLIDSICVSRDSYESAPILLVNAIHQTVGGVPAIRALSSGFYAPEREMTWMCGRSGDIRFRVSEIPNSPVLYLRLAGRDANDDGAGQSVDILMGGKTLATVALTPKPQIFTFGMVSTEIFDIVDISLRARHAEPVLQADGSILDPRLLGVGVYEIGIFNRSDLPDENRKVRSPFVRLLGKIRG